MGFSIVKYRNVNYVAVAYSYTLPFLTVHSWIDPWCYHCPLPLLLQFPQFHSFPRYSFESLYIVCLDWPAVPAATTYSASFLTLKSGWIFCGTYHPHTHTHTHRGVALRSVVDKIPSTFHRHVPVCSDKVNFFRFLRWPENSWRIQPSWKRRRGSGNGR